MKRFLIILSLFVLVKTYSQQTEYADFKTAKADIVFGNLSKHEVSGTITYEFDILKNTDSIYVDANGFKEIASILDGKIQGKLYDGKHLIIKHPFKPNTHHKLDIVWKTSPNKAMYFIDWDYEEGNKQIWTQGQGKYTSNWLPSFDDMNEKVEFDLTITFNKDYEVIANGKLINKQINASTITWHYDMQQPMSGYLVALAIGKYDKKSEFSKSGIPLEMYYYPEDSAKFEPTYRYTKKMFDFLEEEIGVPYPWQNYKQVPVKDFLYAGMENTSTTIFADSFVIDSIAFVDKNYVNVNAHELAHQWFGDLVTETLGTHHWLQEGFATYYALLAERDIFDKDYYYWQLYEYAQELLEQDQAGQSTSLLDPKSSSTTFYKKGALVLHLLREKVGDEAFKKGVKNYLQKHQFKNVETNDFIKEVEKTSGQDLSEFVKVWLENETFQYQEVLTSLKKSKFIEGYLAVDCEVFNPKCNTYLSSNISDEAKIKVISQNSTLIKKEDFNNSLKVRQAIAKNIEEIPLELKEDYESLLSDKSYSTIEAALYNLCTNFPEDKLKYLFKTKDIQGFNNKNIRMLWIVLVLNTPGFEDVNKRAYFNELVDYTSPKYDFETRETAFSYFNAMQVFNETIIFNLINASKHHNWRFKEYSKNLLGNLKQYEKYKILITNLEQK
ncbi:M1 family metallopeptidase [Mariniflexile sp.]|uniref:M1 family metallopeptidase n=1 Tax=Mariniflexile sp. TaxID=1979402 RepID=UPI0040480E5B